MCNVSTAASAAQKGSSKGSSKGGAASAGKRGGAAGVPGAKGAGAAAAGAAAAGAKTAMGEKGANPSAVFGSPGVEYVPSSSPNAPDEDTAPAAVIMGKLRRRSAAGEKPAAGAPNSTGTSISKPSSPSTGFSKNSGCDACVTAIVAAESAFKAKGGAVEALPSAMRSLCEQQQGGKAGPQVCSKVEAAFTGVGWGTKVAPLTFCLLTDTNC